MGKLASLYEAQKLNAFKELFSKNEAAAKIFIRSDNKEWEKAYNNYEKKTIYLTEKYNPNDEFRAPIGHFGEEWGRENK